MVAATWLTSQINIAGRWSIQASIQVGIDTLMSDRTPRYELNLFGWSHLEQGEQHKHKYTYSRQSCTVRGREQEKKNQNKKKYASGTFKIT